MSTVSGSKGLKIIGILHWQATLHIDCTSPDGFNERCRHLDVLDSLLIEDEASFAMNGEVNTQNVRQMHLKDTCI